MTPMVQTRTLVAIDLAKRPTSRADASVPRRASSLSRHRSGRGTGASVTPTSLCTVTAGLGDLPAHLADARPEFTLPRRSARRRPVPVGAGAPIDFVSHAQSLRKAIDAMGISSYALLAHDSGGFVACLTAAEDPRVTALVLSTEISATRPRCWLRSCSWRTRASGPGAARCSPIAASSLGPRLRRALRGRVVRGRDLRRAVRPAAGSLRTSRPRSCDRCSSWAGTCSRSFARRTPR
jgi:pimeloyl-ACP methyl ester carboxylesterase